MSEDKFAFDIQRGDVGEMVAMWMFTNNPKVKSVIRCAHDKRFQNDDIDFIVQCGDRVITYEVKTDYQANITGNLYYEKTTSGNIGCFEKTKADFILLYIYELQRMLVISTNDLREYVKKSNFQLVRGGDKSEGYKIPLCDLLKLKIAKEVKC